MHGDFRKLLDPTVLEINLKLIWSCGVFETKDQEINNANYRYAAYRTIHLWLFAKKRSGRVVLPSCLVNCVRDMYPDVNYVGFSERSPVFKRTRKMPNC